eukprot:scaffold30426_cov25-Prasinocladus_malaysianus.AAC.2
MRYEYSYQVSPASAFRTTIACEMEHVHRTSVILRDLSSFESSGWYGSDLSHHKDAIATIRCRAQTSRLHLAAGIVVTYARVASARKRINHIYHNVPSSFPSELTERRPYHQVCCHIFHRVRPRKFFSRCKGKTMLLLCLTPATSGAQTIYLLSLSISPLVVGHGIVCR